MIDRKFLVDYLNSILQPHLYNDTTYNGLQIEGKSNVKNIGFSVDCSLEIFKKSNDLNIDFLFTHHGLIWKGWNKINIMNKKRLEWLFKNDINLYVSHLPLDANQEFGNNIELLKLLNLEKLDNFSKIGFIGCFNNEIYFDDFLKIVKDKINDNIKYYNFSKNKKIKEIAICSGTINQNIIEEACNKGIENILCGDGMEEILYYDAIENNLNIIFAGHYHTEKFGVMAIMNKIKEEFKNKLNTFFIS